MRAGSVALHNRQGWEALCVISLHGWRQLSLTMAHHPWNHWLQGSLLLMQKHLNPAFGKEGRIHSLIAAYLPPHPQN